MPTHTVNLKYECRCGSSHPPNFEQLSETPVPEAGWCPIPYQGFVGEYGKCRCGLRQVDDSPRRFKIPAYWIRGGDSECDHLWKFRGGGNCYRSYDCVDCGAFGEIDSSG